VSLRKRVSLAAASAVGIAIALAAMVCYLVVSNQLVGQIDSELTAQARAVLQAGTLAPLRGEGFPSIPASAGGPAPYWQIVAPNGAIFESSQNVALPIDADTISVARFRANNVLDNATVGGTNLRLLTVHALYVINAQSGQAVPVAVQLARPLSPVQRVLRQLRLILALLFVGGVVLAALLGRIAARRVLAPLTEVTQTAQVIGETDDLSRRLAVHADDEVGQLATRFNEMLERLEQSRAALDESVRAQRQLVADASHELRTPVTSLRTNIEVLLAGSRLDDEDRDRLLADVVEQSEELSALVSDLIELARGDLPAGATEEVRLDRVVEECLARARRNSPDIEFIETLQPVVVEGVPDRLARAVNNLLDNAARHGAPDGPVEVTVDHGGVRVRDHGHGITPSDLPYVFDRFYRGENSRGRQGSGLGLAIVRQVARSHGGEATATNAPDGGALFILSLPAAGTADEPAEHDVQQAYGAGGLARRV
jgi:two-component system, OmpR family, sensor histidine kinase MprB